MIPIYSCDTICTCDICQVFDYVQKYDGFVDRLLRHLDTSAMMDLLLQIVVAPDTNQIRLDLAQVHTYLQCVHDCVCACACVCVCACVRVCVCACPICTYMYGYKTIALY